MNAVGHGRLGGEFDALPTSLKPGRIGWLGNVDLISLRPTSERKSKCTAAYVIIVVVISATDLPKKITLLLK